MEISKLTNEDKVFIRTIFKEMREKTNNFAIERDFVMSNAQLFTFLSNAPAALAIASDGTVDTEEIAALEKLSRSIDVYITVSIELMEMMAVAFEPENVMSNEEFNMRVGSELLFLSRNMQKYEENFIAAIKALLTFDFNPEKDGSLTSSFSMLMNTMIENNVSKNKEAELKKMNEFKAKIGIAS
ncbi:MAG: hypothetical protein L3J35_12880 [Bacteroidales bacterium]|nr:hypothetical protein [Bacteroidales bacterium]